MTAVTVTFPVVVQVAEEDMDMAHSRIAHEWYTGLALEYAGVDLGDVMTYDVLRVIGRLLVRDRNTGVSEHPVPPENVPEGPSDAIPVGVTEP